MPNETLIGVHRNLYGEILSFQTSTGRIISYRKAILEVEEGKLSGVKLTEDTNGSTVITSIEEKSFEHYPDIYQI